MSETYLDEFKREMAPSEKIFTKEIKRIAKKYDFLGEMKLVEDPDIDTQDYVYCFKRLNGTSKDIQRTALKEMYAHMKAFSKENGIYEFCRNAIILFERDLDEYY